MNLGKCTSVLFVKDAQKSLKLYKDILNMNIVSDFGGVNITFEEGFTIWQVSDDNIVSTSLGAENIYNTQNASRFELYFETDQLDSVYSTLKENKIEFLNEIETAAWGQRSLRFYDYDRHLIEVGEIFPVFIKRVFDEENSDLEATSKRTFVPIEMIKDILNLK